MSYKRIFRAVVVFVAGLAVGSAVTHRPVEILGLLSYLAAGVVCSLGVLIYRIGQNSATTNPQPRDEA